MLFRNPDSTSYEFSLVGRCLFLMFSSIDFTTFKLHRSGTTTCIFASAGLPGPLAVDAGPLSAGVVECATKDDGQEVNVGDIPVRPAYTLRGQVALSDRKPIPPDMRINLFADRVPDSQTLILSPDGFLEFKGLARGVYRLGPSVEGYEPMDTQSMEFLIEGDVSSLNLLLRPATSMKR